MDLREKVAQAVSQAAGCPEEWADWFNEADAAIEAIGDAQLGHEDEAWRVAQLAATLVATGNTYGFADAVADARELLAESRRAVSASTTGDSRG